MHSHTRALVAASAYAAINGQKVAGLYDHSAGLHLRIAAERRGDRLQGLDGDRSAKFGGTLPELYDESDKAFVSLEVESTKARGYDRGTQGHYVAEVEGRLIRLYDYSLSTWFAFDVQLPEDGLPASG